MKSTYPSPPLVVALPLLLLLLSFSVPVHSSLFFHSSLRCLFCCRPFHPESTPPYFFFTAVVRFFVSCCLSLLSLLSPGLLFPPLHSLTLPTPLLLLLVPLCSSILVAVCSFLLFAHCCCSLAQQYFPLFFCLSVPTSSSFTLPLPALTFTSHLAAHSFVLLCHCLLLSPHLVLVRCFFSLSSLTVAARFFPPLVFFCLFS